jgi:hypothetical protein
MHYCPDCGRPCYCDCDDTDYGDIYPEGCPHWCEDSYDDEEDNIDPRTTEEIIE